ncbi:MAG: hypothetical protein SF051_10220 [Elusimicrobiota bacterium]|nr:hypothetical protein [Elusimicrobiota bacterium]
MDKPFQRLGSKSNSQVGSDFERIIQQHFARQGIILKPKHSVEVGVGALKKAHEFDLGCADMKWIVECKSHRWTTGNNTPSAKMTVWNEAMYYFHGAPVDYKKILYVLRDLKNGTGESLAEYYLRTYAHLIPAGVEIWEYDERNDVGTRVDI